MLSDRAIRTSKPREKPHKLYDGSGLHVLVQPSGSKLWRLKYRLPGKEKLISFGSYPGGDAGARAREKRDDARRQLSSGRDPSAQRKLDRIVEAKAAQNTFGAVVAEHLDNMAANGLAETTLVKNRWMLLFLAAPLAHRPIAEIMPIEVLDLLKRIEKRGRRNGAEAPQHDWKCVPICRRDAAGDERSHRTASGCAPNPPSSAPSGHRRRTRAWHSDAGDRRIRWLADASRRTAAHSAHYDPSGRRAVHAAIGDQFRESSVAHTSGAHENAPTPRCSLSRQALEILRGIWSLSDYGDLVLPSIRSIKKPLSENAMNCALRRMGYAKDEMTSHGFRATASTILNERGFNPDVIEAALAHQDKNVIRRAYNRATYWPERMKLLQSWADLLDQFKSVAVAERRAA